jgi:hypothetical protein
LFVDATVEKNLLLYKKRQKSNISLASELFWVSLLWHHGFILIELMHLEVLDCLDTCQQL